MSQTAPLLSICIPTYNRANRLRLSLQAILPQVARSGGLAEVWVSDNGSPDETRTVVEEARGLGPLNYSRNQSNLGVIRNVLRVTRELPRGEFVWLLGDDDVLRPGALGRVIDSIEANRDLQAFYVNFRGADYPRDWPDEAVGGYDGPFRYTANADLQDRHVPRWEELVRGETCLCTQIYAHVVRRRMWVDFWQGKAVGRPYQSSLWTYPHAHMIAHYMVGQPTYYVGEPVLTIFNGGQSWSDVEPLISLVHYPRLARYYKKLGVPAWQIDEYARSYFPTCERFLVRILEGAGGPKDPSIAAYLRACWVFPDAWRALHRAVARAGRPWLLRRALSLLGLTRRGVRRVLGWGNRGWRAKRHLAPEVSSGPRRGAQDG